MCLCCRQRKSFVAYKNVSQIPREAEVRDLQIFVDRPRDAIILPLFGAAVPFHIASIKVTKCCATQPVFLCTYSILMKN